MANAGVRCSAASRSAGVSRPCPGNRQSDSLTIAPRREIPAKTGVPQPGPVIAAYLLPLERRRCARRGHRRLPLHQQETNAARPPQCPSTPPPAPRVPPPAPPHPTPPPPPPRPPPPPDPPPPPRP